MTRHIAIDSAATPTPTSRNAASGRARASASPSSCGARTSRTISAKTAEFWPGSRGARPSCTSSPGARVGSGSKIHRLDPAARRRRGCRPPRRRAGTPPRRPAGRPARARRRPRAAGRPWLAAWIAAPSMPWRAPQAAQARLVAAIESTSTPSRSEMTAAKLTAPAPARAVAAGAARRAGSRARGRAAREREDDDGAERSASRAPTAARSRRRRSRCIGGPARKPSEPIDETAAIPGPGRRVGLAAGGAEHQRHAVGDAEADQEEPGQRRGRLRRSAASPRAGCRSAARRRAAARPAPMRRLIASPTTRPAVIPAVKNEYASAASAGARAEVLAQVEAAPVGHRALRDHHEQAERRRAARRRATAA